MQSLNTAAADPVLETRLGIVVQNEAALLATLFSANESVRKNRSVVMGPAAAVPQTYYAGFCRFLAANGYDVMSFDFRGIGQSKTQSIHHYRNIGFAAWAEHDYPAVIQAMKTRFPDQPLSIVGHSVGGWMPAATSASALIDNLLGVAALSAYWPLIAKPHRYFHALAWYALVPLSTRIFGYWPGFLGLKNDTSAALGQEFAQLAKQPNFIFADTVFAASKNAMQFRGNMHLYQIDDDPWGTPAAVQALLPNYPNARRKDIERISPRVFGAKAIGHIQFFRPQFQQSLWQHALARLDAMHQS